MTPYYTAAHGRNDFDDYDRRPFTINRDMVCLAAGGHLVFRLIQRPVSTCNFIAVLAGFDKHDVEEIETK